MAEILETMKKQKLFNVDNYIMFTDNTSIKVAQMRKNQNNQKQSIGHSKWS